MAPGPRETALWDFCPRYVRKGDSELDTKPSKSARKPGVDGNSSRQVDNQHKGQGSDEKAFEKKDEGGVTFARFCEESK